MFSYFNTILGGIAYADKKGYIPVVDMKNYPNTYLFSDEVGRVNAWEYYFEQPGGMSLEESSSITKIHRKHGYLSSRLAKNNEAVFK